MWPYPGPVTRRLCARPSDLLKDLAAARVQQLMGQFCGAGQGLSPEVVRDRLM